jgi:hypothetical protein
LKTSNHELVEDLKVVELDLERLVGHNKNLVFDLENCLDANRVLKANETDFEIKIKSLTTDVSELSKTVLNKQDAINSYIKTIDQLKRELVLTKCDYETLKQQLDNYSSSSYVLDHMIRPQGTESSNKPVSYNRCPPPVRNNLNKLPEENDITKFVVTTPLVVDPNEVNGESSSASENKSADCFHNAYVEGVVEDCSDSDSERESEVVNVSPTQPQKPKSQIHVIPLPKQIEFVKARGSDEAEIPVTNASSSGPSNTKYVPPNRRTCYDSNQNKNKIHENIKSQNVKRFTKSNDPNNSENFQKKR